MNETDFYLLVSFRLIVMLRETQQCVRSLPPEEGVGGAEAKSRGRGRARGRLFRPSTVWQAEKRGRGERCGAEEVLQEAVVAVATELRRWPDSSECSTVKRRGKKKKWRAKKKKKSLVTCWLEVCFCASRRAWISRYRLHDADHFQCVRTQTELDGS